MQQYIRTLKLISCRNDRAMSSPSSVKLGLRTPENRLSVVLQP